MSSGTEMPFTVDLERSGDSTEARHAPTRPAPSRAQAFETIPRLRTHGTHGAVGPEPVDPDERPTDPASPVHSFWVPKFPKDPGLPDVARLYEEALEHARAVEAHSVPGHSTFRPAPVLRHRYRPVRLPAVHR